MSKYRVTKPATVYEVNTAQQRNPKIHTFKVGDIVDSEMRSNDGGRSYAKTPTIIINGVEYGSLFINKWAKPLEPENLPIYKDTNGATFDKITKSDIVLKPQTLAKTILTHGTAISIGALTGYGINKLWKNNKLGLPALMIMGVAATYGFFIYLDLHLWNSIGGSKKSLENIKDENYRKSIKLQSENSEVGKLINLEDNKVKRYIYT